MSKYLPKNYNFQLLYFSVEVSCGRKIAENITYWENFGAGDITGECNVEICKIVSSISQIRLNLNSVCIFILVFYDIPL